MDEGAIRYERFIDGDKNAFEELMNMYHDSLILFVNGYVRNLTIAEDIAIDTFAELVIKKKRHTGKATFKTFLFTVAKNKAFDYLRKESRRKTIPIDDFVEIPDEAESLEEKVLKDERMRFFNNVMYKINQQQREVLYLLYIEGMSYAEIASILGKSKKQVDHLIQNAKRALKIILEKENYDYNVGQKRFQ